jgi:fluoride exporter
MNWLLVFLGGGLGSATRYAIGLFTASAVKTSFPIGTLLSNLLSCVVIGLILLFFQKEGKPEWVTTLVVIGFCGGLSTFSTFSNENLQLIQQQHHAMAVVNIVLSVLSGIAVIWSLASLKQ